MEAARKLREDVAIYTMDRFALVPLTMAQWNRDQPVPASQPPGIQPVTKCGESML